MKLSPETYKALMSVKFDDMTDTEFHVIFDIWAALTNKDMLPIDPAHKDLVQHLASELQI